MLSGSDFYNTFAGLIVNRAYVAYKEEGNYMAFVALLGGNGSWKCEPVTGMGHRADLVVDAIHRHFEENEDSTIDVIFIEALNKLLDISGAITGLTKLMDIIGYELLKEKKGTNSFFIDKDETVKKLGMLISTYYAAYKKENPGFDAWLENERNYFKNTFDIDILSTCSLPKEDNRKQIRQYIGGDIDFNALSDAEINELYTQYKECINIIPVLTQIIGTKVAVANQNYSEDDTKFMNLILGRDEGFVEVFEGAGQCYPLILEAVHNIFTSDRTSGIDANFKKCLSNAVKVVSSPYEKKLIINLLKYEAEIETSKNDGIKIDTDKLVDILNSN